MIFVTLSRSPICKDSYRQEVHLTSRGFLQSLVNPGILKLSPAGSSTALRKAKDEAYGERGEIKSGAPRITGKTADVFRIYSGLCGIIH